MASSDYFMRQVEGLTDIVSVILFGKKASGTTELQYETLTPAEEQSLLMNLRFLLLHGMINEAENLLFEYMEDEKKECYLEVADHFYSWLEALSDEELENHHFSRQEIDEGRKAAHQLYHG